MSTHRSTIVYGIAVAVGAALGATGALVLSHGFDGSTPAEDQSQADGRSNGLDVFDIPEQLTATSTTTALPETTAGPPSDALFEETFAGNTGMDRFRRGVYQRNVDVHDYYGRSGGSWKGDHPLGCSIPGDPYTTRTLRWDPDESMAQRVATAFYNCNDHMMTSMGDVDGYSLVWFSPNQTFTNVRRVCWDVNLTNLGNRQWWEVAIVPVGEPELFADVGAADLPEQGPGTMVVKFNSINAATNCPRRHRLRRDVRRWARQGNPLPALPGRQRRRHSFSHAATFNRNGDADRFRFAPRRTGDGGLQGSQVHPGQVRT